MQRIAATLALTLVVAACGGNDGADAPATTTPTTVDIVTTSSAPTTTSVVTTTTEAPAPPVVGEAQTDAFATAGFPGSGAPAFLEDVRTETYDEFTRIVFEFDATVPEYRIEYLEGPVKAQPSDRAVDLAGDDFLAITMAPASGVDLSGDEPAMTYEGPDRIDIEAVDVSDLVNIEDFESHLTWVAGLDTTVPFSTSTLEDPARVVLDLHTGAAT